MDELRQSRDGWRRGYEAKEAEVRRCHDLLRRIKQSLEDGALDVPDVIHAVEAEIADVLAGQP